MKKNVAVLIFMALFALAVILYMESADDRLDIEVVFVDDIASSKKTVKLYVLDEYDNIIPVVVEHEETDVLRYVFEVYNYKRNSLPLHCFVPSEDLLKIQSFEKANDHIKIVLEKNKVDESEMNLLLYLLWLNYTELGYKKVTIESGTTVFDSDKINLLK